MKRFKLDRRTMLRAMVGGVAASMALPPLEIFLNSHGTAYADCGLFPKRFGIWYWANGVIPERWKPVGEGDSYAMGPQTMPLEPYRSKLTFVTGTRVMTPNTEPHGSGRAGLLAGGDRQAGGYPGPTLDQIVADLDDVGGATTYRSVELGVQRSNGALSYSGATSANPPETSPRAFYERIFGATFREPGAMSEPDPRLRLRRSVLDVVRDQAARLRGRLGAHDRQRLDAHMDSVSEIEQRLMRLETQRLDLAACVRPGMPEAEYPDIDGRPQLKLISELMSDLLAMAMACDQTRVFSLIHCQPVSNVLFPGANAGYHQLTHDEPDPQPQVDDILIRIHQDLAYFLGALDRIEEGTGQTLLDHCLVLCTSDVSYGRTHAIDDFPILLAGGACGSIRTGIHYRSAGESATRVSLTLLQAMGVQRDSFGFGAGRSDTTIGALIP